MERIAKWIVKAAAGIVLGAVFYVGSLFLITMIGAHLYGDYRLGIGHFSRLYSYVAFALGFGVGFVKCVPVRDKTKGK